MVNKLGQKKTVPLYLSWAKSKVGRILKRLFHLKFYHKKSGADFTKLIRDNLQRIELITLKDFCEKFNIFVDRTAIKIPYPPKIPPSGMLVMFNSEIKTLCAIARGIKAKNILEIGTFEGETAANIAYNIDDNSKIYTLDFYPYQLFSGIKAGKYIKEDPRAEKLTEMINADSLNFDFAPFYEKIDMVFIDGGKTYECTASDSENAFKCLREGGFIIWHDFINIHTEVVSAIFDFVKKRNLKLYLIDGTRMAITPKTTLPAR
ncbi:MAG: hypothetical protein GF375_03330 [Candidatus Omnitrophica bacterium]|nr:hypothetical protein [Candidatus Omnitrophota bacterium]MBD3269109.1 hypothetical protein [Candidatus Omnitrophota bacterium]